MTLRTLHLEESAADVLACALLHAIDDLEARAIIAEHHDPVLGPLSRVPRRRHATPACPRPARQRPDAVTPSGSRPLD